MRSSRVASPISTTKHALSTPWPMMIMQFAAAWTSALATDFAAVAKLVGVDANGEPNGTANEEARYIMDATSVLLVDLPEVMKAPERITQRLNSAGITGMLDAAVAPELLPMYDGLEKSGKLTVRTTLAQWYDP